MYHEHGNYEESMKTIKKPTTIHQEVRLSDPFDL